MITPDQGAFNKLAAGGTIYEYDKNADNTNVNEVLRADAANLATPLVDALKGPIGRPSPDSGRSTTGTERDATKPKPRDVKLYKPGPGNVSGGIGTGADSEPAIIDRVGDLLAHLSGIVGANPVYSEKGSKYGSPFGMNPDGIKSPVAQAGAGVVSLLMTVFGGALDGQILKVAQTLERTKVGQIIDYGISRIATRKYIRSVFRATLQTERAAGRVLGGAAADRLGYKLAEERVEALLETKVIGPYDVMREFTEGFGGEGRVLSDHFHAHHLVPKNTIRKFRVGVPERGPSVILRGAEHLENLHPYLNPLLENAKTAGEARKILVDYYTGQGNLDWANAVDRWFKSGGKM